MQKKKNTQLRLSDFAAILICSSAMVISLFLFFKNINKELVKNTENQIATISFKYRSAQRKFSDGVIWDKLRNNSAVYNGDTIRTASSSEATVYFDNGNALDLHENTLAQIYTKKKDGEISILFDRGNLSLQTGDNADRVIIESKKGNIVIESKSSLSVSINNSIQKVQVIEGNAQVITNTAAVVLSAGEVIETAEDSVILDEPSVAMIEPIQNYRYLNHTGLLTNIIFRWKTSNMPADAKLFLNLYTDKRYSVLYASYDVTNRDELDTPLPNGMFYWRLLPVLQDSAIRTRYDSGQLLILDAPSPSVIVPKNAEYTYENEVPQIRFSWKGNDWVSLYQVEVADNIDMLNPIAVKTSQSESCYIGTLTEGLWYWRIIPIYTIQKTDTIFTSDVNSFTIKKIVKEIVKEEPVSAPDPADIEEIVIEDIIEQGTVSSVQPDIASASIIESEPSAAGKDEPEKEIVKPKDTVPAAQTPVDASVVFEETEIIKPTMVFEEVALEKEDTEADDTAFNSQAQIPKVLITRITRNAASQASKSMPLVENDYSDSFSWRAWSDISSGGKSTAAVNTVEVIYKDALYAGIQLTGTVKESAVKQYGLSLYMSNMDIPSSLRRSNNIRFKVVGDGNEYSMRFGTSNTGDQYECRFATQTGIVMEFDIPYSMFKQFSGKKITAFDSDQISSFSFAPVNPTPGAYKLTVFDIEPY
ncbi:MAG: CIA30 family protein [Spirochaetaceae bacterium]|nr:CIA30 family protein [Spirochaetaceae bacterium]